MTELETLQRAKMYMERLANGINPLDESVIPEGEVINHVRLSRCLFYVADVLRQVIENGGISKNQKVKKHPFSLPIERRQAFVFSEKPLTITEIVTRINDLLPEETMTKLKTTTVTQWLLSIDLLKIESNAEGKSTRRPTSQGENMGIGVEHRNSLNGPYTVVTYHLDAQHFVLDNIDAMIAYEQSRTENQGKPWSAEEDRYLLDLHQKNVPINEIALELKRNNSAIRARLKNLESLKWIGT